MVGKSQIRVALVQGLARAAKARAVDEGRPLQSVVNDALVMYLQTECKYLAREPDTTLQYPFRDPDRSGVLRARPADVLPFVPRVPASPDLGEGA